MGSLVEKSVAREVTKQFSERFAECEHFSEISRTEIGPNGFCVCALSTDLNHANDFVAGKNWRADDFLNGLG
jgi:hypothetical protein